MSEDLSKGRAFGYVRASTKEQQSTLKIQQDCIEAEYRHRYASEYRWGGCYIDSGVSGKTPLANRPAGSKLTVELSRGDVLIVHKLDRAFRSARDLIEMLDQWRLKGVRLVMMDLSCDTASAVGQMLVGMLGLVADWERSRIRERRLDLVKSRRKAGRPSAGRRAPLGFKHVGKPGDMYYQGDAEQRKLMGWMMAKHVSGWSPAQIRWQLNVDGVKTWEGKEWTNRTVEAHLSAEAVIAAFEREHGRDYSDCAPPVELIDAVKQRRRLDTR